MMKFSHALIFRVNWSLDEIFCEWPKKLFVTHCCKFWLCVCRCVKNMNCRYGNHFHMNYTHSISVMCQALVLWRFHLPSINWSADPWTPSKLSVLKSCRKVPRCTRTCVSKVRICTNCDCSFQIQEKDVTHTPESTAASKERRSWNQRTFPSCLTIPWRSQKK